MDYKVSINEIEQYKNNIDSAESYLNYSDTMMSSVTNALTRARELAVQGANGTQNAQTRQAIEAETAALRDEVLRLSNSQFRNKYVFSGYSTDTAAFDNSYNYQGDAGLVNVIIDSGATMALNITGDNAFTSGGVSYMQTLENLRSALNTNDVTVIQNSIAAIDSALSQVANVRADIGSRVSALDGLKQNQSERAFTFEKLLSDVEDTDIAKTASEIAKTELALESLRQSGVRVMTRSLLDFLG
jgi:flagellar hook-associated protein 3 FlgL